MTLTQRDDDADMLVDIARVTGLGRLTRRPAQRKSRPQVCWAVQSKLECRRLVDLLKRYPLRGRRGASSQYGRRPSSSGLSRAMAPVARQRTGRCVRTPNNFASFGVMSIDPMSGLPRAEALMA
jgi:hypothetical protein